MHKQITVSSKSNNPCFGKHNYKLTKVGIKSSRFARESVLFCHAWMYLPRRNCVCMFRYVQIIANAACRVSSQ